MRFKVDVTHPDRVLFAADGITRGDLVGYYAELAPVMLPHLAGRPLTLTRFPAGDNFGPIRATARAVGGVLDDLGLAVYVQTTGSRGLHVVSPLRRGANFDTTRQFAREVSDLVVADDPGHRTTEVRNANRDGRVYLDVMRNAYGQTTVAPYAVRARPGAPVATPLDWSELGDRGMRADRLTLRDVPKRVSERQQPVGRHGSASPLAGRGGQAAAAAAPPGAVTCLTKSPM